MSKQLGTIVIGGGSGFIGSSIQRLLAKRGYDTTVVSRKPGSSRMTWNNLQNEGLPDNTVGVINVAGQNVLDPLRRWTAGFKQNVYSSRVHTTRYLSEAIKSAKVKPKVFISISGVGYYPPSADAVYDESSSGGDFDFLSRLCNDWEGANEFPQEMNVRSVKIRSGVVIARHGGMISQLYAPFFLGLGGPVGTGDQFMPWIHLDDITGLFLHALDNEKVEGVVNGVSPQVITNKGFTKSFAKAMGRPGIIPMPVFALNLLFSKERAKIMVEGQKVFPRKALDTGYVFKYDNIDEACKSSSKLLYADDLV